MTAPSVSLTPSPVSPQPSMPVGATAAGMLPTTTPWSGQPMTYGGGPWPAGLVNPPPNTVSMMIPGMMPTMQSEFTPLTPIAGGTSTTNLIPATPGGPGVMQASFAPLFGAQPSEVIRAEFLSDEYSRQQSTGQDPLRKVASAIPEGSPDAVQPARQILESERTTDRVPNRPPSAMELPKPDLELEPERPGKAGRRDATPSNTVVPKSAVGANPKSSRDRESELGNPFEPPKSPTSSKSIKDAPKSERKSPGLDLDDPAGPAPLPKVKKAPSKASGGLSSEP